MDLKKLTEPLKAHEIEFRVQSINNGGYATILAYKDARVDMQRLDEAVGPENWQREHINANHNCKVSIWCDKKNQWISKEDTGTESNTEAAKGLASDSFKRACFNWGIGRELYNYPVISVRLFDNEWQKGQGNQRPKATWNLKIKDWQWFSQFYEGELSYLVAQSWNGSEWVKRFEWGKYNETQEEK